MRNRRDVSLGQPPTQILVVDDVVDSLLSTQLLLAEPDLSVLIASSATEALDLLQQHEVAIALLDVQMPGINGFQLAERMRASEHTRGVPIIFLTGDPAVMSRTFEGYDAGAVDFLIKPADPRVLRTKVRVFVDLHLQRHKLRERNEELERLLKLTQQMAKTLYDAHGKAVHDAHTDSLSGVSNRRHILQLGEAALLDRRRQSQPLTLAILDLDHFKAVNDLHGHHVGDSVICAFCERINHQIRPPHMLGRLGGEEFLLLMPGTPVADAEVVLERVRLTLKPHEGVRYTFSAGVAQAGKDEKLKAVVERADHALYEAKSVGRDCCVTSPVPP